MNNLDLVRNKDAKKINRYCNVIKGKSVIEIDEFPYYTKDGIYANYDEDENFVITHDFINWYKDESISSDEFEITDMEEIMDIWVDTSLNLDKILISLGSQLPEDCYDMIENFEIYRLDNIDFIIVSYGNSVHKVFMIK